jgi:hypothetical protein
VTTRAQVEALLGTPDLKRERDRYCVYSWTQQHGEWWIVPAAPMAGTATGMPAYATFHTLFLEFDPAGVVGSAERGTRHGKTLRFCNAQGACVEHWDLNCLNVETLGFTPEPFCDPAQGRGDQSVGIEDVMSSFTLPPAADAARLEHAAAIAAGQCRLLLSVAADVPDDGVEFLVDGLWPAKLWLPKDAYAVIDLPAGAHVIEGCGATRARVECRAGETLALVLGDARKRQQRCAGDALPLNSWTEASWQASLATKRRVLLPEVEGRLPESPQDDAARP